MQKLLTALPLVALLSTSACMGIEDPDMETGTETGTAQSSLQSPQCFVICTTSSPCDQYCIEGDTPFNCGGHGVCKSGCTNACDCGPGDVCNTSTGNCEIDFGPFPECKASCHCGWGEQCINGSCW